MKVFRLDVVPENARTFADRLERLQELAGVDEAIVTPYAAGIEGTVPYLAEEYIAAESLDIALRHYAPAPVGRALTFIVPLARAIDAASERGIFHGGLHPRDIFVTPDRARAGGFGIAQALDAIGVRAPIRRPYSAPERVSGGAWDGRADVYSLAVVAYELLTGRRVSGSGGQDRETLATVPGVADVDALQAVFRRGLHESPSARFESAGALVRALERTAVRDEETTSSLTAAAPEAAPSLLEDVDGSAAGPAPRRARRPRRAKAEHPGDVALDRGATDVSDLPLRFAAPAAASGIDVEHRLQPDTLADASIPAAESQRPAAPGEAAVEEEPPPALPEPAPLPQPAVESSAAEVVPDSPSAEVPGETTQLDAAVNLPREREAPSRGLPEELTFFGGAFADEGEDVGETGEVAAAEGQRYIGSTPELEAGVTSLDGASDVVVAPVVPEAGPLPAGELAADLSAVPHLEAGLAGLRDRGEPLERDAARLGDRRLESDRDRTEAPAAPRAPQFLRTTEPEPMDEGSRWRFSPVAFAATLFIGIAIGLAWGYWLGGGATREVATDESSVVVDEAPATAENMRAPSGTAGRRADEAAPARRAAPPAASTGAAKVEGPGTTASVRPGRLVLRSTPPGARVHINGMLRGTTPLELSGLPFGGYRIEVSRSGYRTETRRVTLSAAQSEASADIRLSPATSAAAPVTAPAPPPAEQIGASPPAAPTTSMFFDTRPRGAQVVLDGRVVGVTPLELPNVTAGEHDVRFELQGYRRWSTRARVTPGRQTRIAASLER